MFVRMLNTKKLQSLYNIKFNKSRFSNKEGISLKDKGLFKLREVTLRSCETSISCHIFNHVLT